MVKMAPFIVFLISFTLSAQIQFNTGSPQLDEDLNAINDIASSDFYPFKMDLLDTYTVSGNQIDYMRVVLKMKPAEIYYALDIAKLSNTPVDRVTLIYKKHKNKGWGYIARQFGIILGSSGFYKLKDNASRMKTVKYS